MAKKTKNVVNANNSNITTITKNVVTENSAKVAKVEAVELTAKTANSIALGDSIRALDSFGVIDCDNVRFVGAYDDEKKKNYLDSLRSRWRLPTLTMAQKLSAAYDDGRGYITYSRKKIGFTADLESAFGVARCLSLWFNQLPKKTSKSIERCLNADYPEGGYKSCDFDAWLDIVNEHYKDLLNLLGYNKGVTKSDISVNGDFVAWSNNNDTGKKTLHPCGLYFSAVPDNVGGWCSALGSLDIVTKHRMRVALNKISDNKFSQVNVTNYLGLVLDSGVDVDTLHDWLDSACRSWAVSQKEQKEDAREKIIARVAFLRSQKDSEWEKCLKLSKKLTRLKKYNKMLNKLRALASDSTGKYPAVLLDSWNKRLLRLSGNFPAAYFGKLPGLVNAGFKRCEKLNDEIMELRKNL